MLEIVAVTLVSLAAGFVNSIAGGGGLVSLPILFALYPATPPATLFGTNKAAMVWGTAWAAGSYARHVNLPWRMLVPAVMTALAGAGLGAWLVTLVSGDWLRRLLPVLLALVLAYTIWKKDIGQTHAPKLTGMHQTLLGAFIALVLGIYDGFFGPGTGSFFIFLFVRLLGFDFLNAVACAKVLNTATNLASLAVFAWSGHVWWPFVLPMALANVAGSVLGTTLALKYGSGFVRFIFVLVVGCLILKTGFDAYLR